MPNAELLVNLLPPLYAGAGILMIMDASFNVSMEPFRALVADLLPSDQRTLGFSVQTFLIGIGAVIGSWLPLIFAEIFGVQKEAPGIVPFNVTLSFYIGASVFLIAILWTVITTKEYPPTPDEHRTNTLRKRNPADLFGLRRDAQDNETTGSSSILFVVRIVFHVGVFNASNSHSCLWIEY